MNLTEILDQISIGYLQNDSKSKKLKEYTDEIKDILEKPNMLFDQRSLTFNYLELGDDISSDESQIFFQGSYAIHTAIKHINYEVDADIAFYINDIDSSNIRIRIFDILYSNLGEKYKIELKKPCITIDFNDGYKIDVAIYTKSIEKGVMMFHNSINGSEQQTPAKPKTIIKTFNDYFKNNDIKRPIIRLIKHFVKNATENLHISNNNKIPTISLMLIALAQYAPNNDTLNESSLSDGINEFAGICYQIFNIRQLDNIDNKDLLISNTLYKIDDYSQVKSVISEIKLQLGSKNYASLVSNDVYNAITLRSTKDSTPALIGTMGE